MASILVVEDSPTQAQELRLILESEGFAVDTVPDGRGVPERLRSAPFDLVLSDVLMPELSGYDLCRALKTDPQTRGIAVVLLTQLADPLDILLGLECGADNFLTKPVDPHYLVHRIRSVLANRGRPPGALSAGGPLFLRGRGVTITADKGQILDLLLSTLEEVIHTRTREQEVRAANAALQQQGQELARAGRRKDEFVAMLAHELRNPLAPLLTNLHALRQAGPEGRSWGSALDAMERQVRHLGRLLDGLLDSTRLTWGMVLLRRDRLDLARLTRTAAEDRRRWLEQDGLALTVEVPETPVWVAGDAAGLLQVLDNLLDNAAKFTDPGGRVAVGLTADTARGQAVVTVRDSGSGIDPDLLPRLFEPFTQADQGLDRPRGGLGLGLSVVKGLVELHAGQVQAASAGPGCGAEFTARLPLEAELAALAGAPVAPGPAGERPAGERLKVVVIEDNRDAADSLQLLLGLLGHEVRVAYSGPEGLQAASEVCPDVVLSDIGLPGLDGYGVAAALRRQPATAQARLIAVTGYGAEEDRRRSREAGFDFHLVKPVEPEELLRLLAGGRGPSPCSSRAG
jgi:CheY-like chemotaxis protein/two-component sensor histidine kinase